MPYLTIDVDRIRLAWEDARYYEPDVDEPVMAVEEQLSYGRRAVVVHVPQSWPHGVRCHNCAHPYPCRIALWGMRLLQERGWEFANVIDLIEAVQAGERL